MGNVVSKNMGDRHGVNAHSILGVAYAMRGCWKLALCSWAELPFAIYSVLDFNLQYHHTLSLALLRVEKGREGNRASGRGCKRRKGQGNVLRVNKTVIGNIA